MSGFPQVLLADRRQKEHSRDAQLEAMKSFAKIFAGGSSSPAIRVQLRSAAEQFNDSRYASGLFSNPQAQQDANEFLIQFLDNCILHHYPQLKSLCGGQLVSRLEGKCPTCHTTLTRSKSDPFSTLEIPAVDVAAHKHEPEEGVKCCSGILAGLHQHQSAEEIESWKAECSTCCNGITPIPATKRLIIANLAEDLIICPKWWEGSMGTSINVIKDFVVEQDLTVPALEGVTNERSIYRPLLLLLLLLLLHYSTVRTHCEPQVPFGTSSSE
jgi:ubiquitin C-terminal hydrolase